MFCYVLHHAASHTFKLLQEAVRVTPPGGYVLVSEDLANATDAVRSARNLLHDTNAIFRSDAEWRALMSALGLEVVQSGALFGDDNPQHFYIARPR